MSMTNIVKSTGIHICRRPFAAPAGVFRFLKRLPVDAFDVSGCTGSCPSRDVSSVDSSFFTFIGITPGSYMSPRPGFRFFFRSLKKRLSSSRGASASRFKLLSLSASSSFVSFVVIICHSPTPPCDG